jgi:hypothetical protein
MLPPLREGKRREAVSGYLLEDVKFLAQVDVHRL